MKTKKLSIIINVLILLAICHWSTAQQKAVLITGATSGIGLKTTKLLASKGHFVYAGARKQEDMDRLNKIKNVQAVRLDVTKQEDIDEAVKTIRGEGRGLYALVNNAGVSILSPLIETDEGELKWMFDINVYGPYRVTKAFAPLIIESKGRITTTGSISGILPGMFAGPYSMTKHAIEGFTDALAIEMEQFGVHVSVVDPGGYETKIREKGIASMEAAKERYVNSPYREAFLKTLEGRANPRKNSDEVAEMFLKALFEDNPTRRYMIVPNEGQGTATIKQAMREMLELNQNQPYKLSREELLSIMDGLLSEMD